MKVLLINGSPRPDQCTFTALSEVAKALREEGAETEIYQIGTAPVAGCIDCGTCAKTGKCVFSDGVNDIAARLKEFDGIVVGAPVYYAGPCGQICCFLDRLFSSTSSAAWEGKVGAAIVSCRRGGASASFDRLNKYFTISNMPVVSSQYWNQVHGSSAEEVLRDEEGLQTMRTLGKNMACLIRQIQAGRAAGVNTPVREKRKRTDFIR